MRAVYSGGATEATDQRLARQYQSFRYPKPDAGAEGKRLIIESPSHHREIDYRIFRAARRASRKLNAVSAGDASMMFAP